jgi:hypothetical protein
MFYDSDLDIFFTDFAQMATYTPQGGTSSAIPVVFNTAYQVAVDIDGFAGVSGYKLIVEAKTADVPNVKIDDTIIIGGKTYYITEIQQMDFGTTRLTISEVQ